MNLYRHGLDSLCRFAIYLVLKPSVAEMLSVALKPLAAAWLDVF